MVLFKGGIELCDASIQAVLAAPIDRGVLLQVLAEEALQDRTCSPSG